MAVSSLVEITRESFVAREDFINSLYFNGAEDYDSATSSIRKLTRLFNSQNADVTDVRNLMTYQYTDGIDAVNNNERGDIYCGEMRKLVSDQALDRVNGGQTIANAGKRAFAEARLNYIRSYDEMETAYNNSNFRFPYQERRYFTRITAENMTIPTTP